MKSFYNPVMLRRNSSPLIRILPSQPHSHTDRVLDRDRDQRDRECERDRERDREVTISRFRDWDRHERDRDRDRRLWERDKGRVRGGIR
jgi:hypothetical protein